MVMKRCRSPINLTIFVQAMRASTALSTQEPSGLSPVEIRAQCWGFSTALSTREPSGLSPAEIRSQCWGFSPALSTQEPSGLSTVEIRSQCWGFCYRVDKFDTILDFGLAFAQRCASNFWIGEASRSHGFSLRTAASSV